MKTVILLGRIRTSLFLLFCIFMMSTTSFFAQSFDDLDCAAEFAASTNWCDEEFTKSVDPVYLASFDPVVFNIIFWRIVKDDGTFDTDHVNQNDALLAIANINQIFNQYNMFFKYRGFNDIPSTEIYVPTKPSDISNWLNNYSGPPEEVENPNSLNMYIPYDFVQAYGGSGTLFGTRSNIKRELFTTWGMIHELGHNMGLVHTFQFYQENPQEECEHVTRIETDPDYNADTNGDRVTDTAATLVLRAFNTNAQTCLYEGNDQDCAETDYIIYDEDVRNYMNYVPEVGTCEKIFSIGQAIRMRESIDINCYNKYDNVMTTDLSSLYEPYEGEYYMAGPTLPIHKPLFQPGFDYRFVDCNCSCPQPILYGDLNFTYNNANIVSSIDADDNRYEAIVHPNHSAIRILQLEENTTQPQRCYDNTNRSPNGGSILQFNDGVFNTNVTVSPQDSTSINNPQLIDNLQPGLYNIIEQYNDGGTQETVIIKYNN